MTTIAQQFFGHYLGQDVMLYTLTNRAGTELSVTNYGCTVTRLLIADRNGRQDDIVLGFDCLDDYLAHDAYFGSIVGRCANRIANGQFILDGNQYQLTCNETVTGQHLHGGRSGFDKQVWQAAIDGDGIIFHRVSPAGEEGYPGNLSVFHRISLSDDNCVTFDFWAEAEQPTLVNLANHNYYNLAGHHQTIHGHYLQIFSDFVTPVEAVTLLPNGEIRAVAGSCFDFRQPALLGERMQAKAESCFDINYVLATESDNEQLVQAAQVYEPHSGRKMTVATNQPGLQFYNSAKLPAQGLPGKSGIHYRPFSGLCLETQAFPDSIHWPHFPNVILRPKQRYFKRTEHRFSLDE